jgi:hypothetical protein
MLMDGMVADPQMAKAKDKVLVAASGEAISWNTVSDLLARGCLQEAGWETFGSKSPTALD